MLALILGAPAPLAATIRGRLAFDAADLSGPTDAMHPTSHGVNASWPMTKAASQAEEAPKPFPEIELIESDVVVDAQAEISTVSADVVLPSAESHEGDETGDKPEIQAFLDGNAVLAAVEVLATSGVAISGVDAAESNDAVDAVAFKNGTVVTTVLPMQGEIESMVAFNQALVEDAAVDYVVGVAVSPTVPVGCDDSDGAVDPVYAAATEASVPEATGLDATKSLSVILDSAESVLGTDSVLDVAVDAFEVGNVTNSLVKGGSQQHDNFLTDSFKDTTSPSQVPGDSCMFPATTFGSSNSSNPPYLSIPDWPGQSPGKECESFTNAGEASEIVTQSIPDCLSKGSDHQVLCPRPDMASDVLILPLVAISESGADSPSGTAPLAEGVNAPILDCYEPAEYQQDDDHRYLAPEMSLLPVVETISVSGVNQFCNHLAVDEQLMTCGVHCSECDSQSVDGMVLGPYDLGEVPGVLVAQLEEVEVKNEQEKSENPVQVERSQGPLILQKETSVLESSGHGESDYDSDPESNTPRPLAPCPRSHVALASVSWTPQPNLPSSLMPDLECARAEVPGNVVSECNPDSESCRMPLEIGDVDTTNLQRSLSNIQTQGSGPESTTKTGNNLTSIDSSSLLSVSAAATKPKHQHHSGLGLDRRPRLVKAFKCGVEDALGNLRNALHSVCKQRGIANADSVLSRLLQSADPNGTNRLSVASLANALSIMHVHLRKYLIRPLKANPAYFEDDCLKIDAFLEALNSEQWWPLNLDFEDNQENLEKLFRDLEAKFGPKISAALFAGQNFDHLRSLLIEAERDEEALREMKSFVDDRLQRQSIEGLCTKSMLLDKKPSTARQELLPHDGSLKTEQTLSPYTRSVPSFINPRFSRNAVKCDVHPKLPDRCRSVDLVRTMRQNGLKSVQLYKQCDGEKLGLDELRGQKHGDGIFSKMNPFVGSGYLPALSRKKGIEYAKQKTGTAVDNTAIFWQKLAFPMHAVKYKRWDLLNDPVLPGFSHPSYVHVSKPAEAWECPKRSEPKCGSRFNESFSVLSSLEVLDKSSMQNADLKVQRLNNKLVLQGGDLLRDVKKLAQRGDFDCALHSAATALQNFKSSGNSGIHGTQELGEPIQYVASTIKSQIEKRIKISQSQLERGNFERSLEQIPFLLHASRWLAKLQPFDQPAYVIAVPDVTHQARSIHTLTANIIAAQRECALSVEAASLISYFSSIKEEFDVDGTPTSESVNSATKRKNNLPETIIADGRAYVMVLDAKPADMPAKFQLGTKLKIQGAGVLGSGRQDDGSKPRFGTVTAFNESSSKYKIQFTDDYEWMSWPHTGHYMVEIDIYPEDVEIEIPGFCVQSKTVNLMRSTPQNEAGLIMVIFVVTPCRPSFESSPFGRLSASVTGVKSGKALLDSMESGVVQVLPPLFLLPSSRYLLFDAVHNQRLDQGVAEFVHVGSKQKFVFASGQEVVIPQDGVYNICFRGQTHFDSPSFTYSHKTCIVLNEINRKYIADTTKVFLNEPLLQKDELRVTVSWNSEPLELDLHVYTSSGEHFTDEDCESNILTDVRIEMDSVAGFGPETVTIRVKPYKTYSVSLCLSNCHKGINQWGQCNATVALYNCSGIFSMFNLPPSKHSNKTHTWWHVFALDGCKWDKPGHGVLRVNKLMAEEMPQIALPGWRMIYSASHGLWDEFRDTLLDLVHKRIQNDQLMIMPQDMSNATSLRGETILGLMCLHNEDEGEDPSNGNEEGETPLQKQIDSAKKFLKAAERQTTTAESILSGGLPTYETFLRECKCCGSDDCYIFRAISYASTGLALLILNTLSPVVKQSLPGHGYRKFFENQGESLLLACITRRTWKSVLPVLRGILSIEAVWQRRSTRKFQSKDFVQVEIPAGSGKWLNGIVLKKIHNLYEVGITKNSDLQVQEEANMEHALSEQAIMSDISSSQLRWRSRVVDYLKTKCARHRERLDLTYVQAHPAANATQKGSSHIDAVFSEALVLLSDKMVPLLKC